MEKRCGDTVLNCNERCGHCSSLQWWPTAMQSGCLGLGFAVQYTAKKPTPLRLLCSRHRLRPLAMHPIGHCSREFGPVLIFLCSRWAARRLDPPPPGSCAATTGTEAAAGDAVAKVARPLLNCANVRGATANLKLTFHLDHSVGADHSAIWELS